MTPEQFCYWLQGSLELTQIESLTPKKLDIVKSHLNLVFLHTLDPQNNETTTTKPEVMNEAHGNKKVYRC